jgi:sigma-B regulation protein RsbU (phosphoserine phosphatase)
MIEPKTFYRKLDFLLNKIDTEQPEKNFLISIANELEATFGDDLHIYNVRIYLEDDFEYILIHSPQNTSELLIKESYQSDSEAIQRIRQNGTYIFDDLQLSLDKNISNQTEYAIPAAFTVRSPEYRWIFVLELKSDWIREEIEFCLNAVRTALNYRLVSESVISEKNQAKSIQQSLLPSYIPDFKGYHIAARSSAADIVGGDLYDFYNYTEERLGLCIGDASGHGLPAALLTRDVITGLRMGLGPGQDIIKVCKKLNRVIFASVLSSHFISLFYADIEQSGLISYVNAGHPAPILFQNGAIQNLDPTGIIFGAVKDMDIERATVTIEDQGVLVLFTDAFFERHNNHGEMYGLERLQGLVREHHEKSVEDLLNVIFETVYDFGKPANWDDDATILVIKKDN